MNIVNNFKNHLLAQKNPPSKITIKNYLSDVRRFINWYEQSTRRIFSPEELTSNILTAYQTELMGGDNNSLPAARSAKRYLSSLRRFGQFLKDSGAIEANPFLVPEPVKTPIDPWFIQDFKNFLSSEQASKLTIKNYLIDVKQFLSWLETVTSNEPDQTPQTILRHISNYALQSYKMRLFHERHFSPVSINRKLSSIRRYVRWLEEKGVIEKFLDLPEPVKEMANVASETGTQVEAVLTTLPLTALQGLADEEKKKHEVTYSSFAPIRLVQKTAKLITLGADMLFFNPIASAGEAIQYKLLKRGTKQVFAPVKTILETASYIPEGVSVKTIIPKATSIIPPRFANIASVKQKLINFGISNNPSAVHNFTKALYAPLLISTTHMNWKQKLLYHLRYTRPDWYRKYHSFEFASYLHFAVMIFAVFIAGLNLYQVWHSSGNQNQAVLAAQSLAPPRTVAFQGRLLDSNNTPITAETPLRFALYNSPTASGAAMLWQEKQSIKPDRNGYFTVNLGKLSRLEQSLFTDNPSLYVGISVNERPELKPRQQLPTTTFAANSQTVQGMKPITDSPDKTNNVLLALDSIGNLTIGGSANPTFQATGGQFTLSGQTTVLTTNPGSNGNLTIAPDGSGIVDIQKPIQNTSDYNNPSNIRGAVNVADILSVYTNANNQSAFNVNQNGTGGIISGTSNGVAKFVVDSTGNTIIGGNLNVNGNTIRTSASTFGIANENVTNLRIGGNASALSLGGGSGVTTINNDLTIQGKTSTTGLLTANGGVTIPVGQKLVLADFKAGSIPFVDNLNNIVQNTNFSWLDNQQTLKIIGALCVRASDGACGSTPGTIYASNATVQAADLAENYVSGQKLEAGDVVIPEGKDNNAAIMRSNEPYQRQLIGIVSTKPGFILNSDASADANHPNIYPLALQGRVPVKISSMNGPIEAGDDLTSSSIPGVAMKATGSGQTIGKALESYAATDSKVVGKIMAFVNLSYHSEQPSSLTKDGNITGVKEITSTNLDPISELGATFVKAGTIVTDSIIVATDHVSINGVSLNDYIAGVVNHIVNASSDPANIMNTTTVSAASMTPTATAGASLKQDSPLVDLQASTSGAFASSSAFPIYNSMGTPISSVSGVASASAQATTTPSVLHQTQPNQASSSAGLNLSEPTASASALIGLQNDITMLFNTVSQLSDQTFAKPSDLGLENLDIKAATVSGTLSVFGRTTLNDVGIAGKVTIGLMNIDGLNNDGFATINTSAGSLKIQSDGRNGVEFLGGKVAIDTHGNLNVAGNASFAKDVTVKGKLATSIIAPIPGSDLAVQNSQGKNVLQINQQGDVEASGGGKFGGLSIVRTVDADTSVTESVSHNSAGKGIIKANQTTRTIFTPYVTEHSLIYVTATSNTQSGTPYLARQTVENAQGGTRGSFTIQIPRINKQNVTFNWWIVN